jgi:hypothetical protein
VAVDGDEEQPDGEEGEKDKESDEVDDNDLRWAHDPELLLTLEQLRCDFSTELQDPSAWTLGRVMVLIEDHSLFAAAKVVKRWLHHVAQSTCTLQGERLRLPSVARSQHDSLRQALAREANRLVGEDQEQFFGREVEERYKRDARSTILFLFPNASTGGLSTGDKKRISTIASNIWAVDHLRAEGLLWVLNKEYHYTQQEAYYVSEWANYMSEEFMNYTALFPPPISPDH